MKTAAPDRERRAPVAEAKQATDKKHGADGQWPRTATELVNLIDTALAALAVLSSPYVDDRHAKS